MSSRDKGHDIFDRQFAIKFEWSENTEQGGWMLLETARAKNVKGVVRLEIHQMLCTITSQALIFTEPYIQVLDDSHGMEKHERDRAALQRSPAELSEDNQKLGFDDLTLNCVVTSPLGQALDTFDTPKQMLTVLRDVIHAFAIVVPGRRHPPSGRQPAEHRDRATWLRQCIDCYWYTH